MAHLLEQEQKLKITLFQQRLVQSKSQETKTTVTKYIPITLQYDNTTAYQFQRLVDTAITDAVIAHLEDISDARSVQAIEYYLNDYGLSLSGLCQQPQKISDAFYSIWKEGADVVFEQIIQVSYRTFGFKYEESTLGSDSRTKLADSLTKLKRMILESSQRQGSN